MSKNRKQFLYLIDVDGYSLAIIKSELLKNDTKVVLKMELGDAQYNKVVKNTRLSKDGICYLEE